MTGTSENDKSVVRAETNQSTPRDNKGLYSEEEPAARLQFHSQPHCEYAFE